MLTSCTVRCSVLYAAAIFALLNPVEGLSIASAAQKKNKGDSLQLATQELKNAHESVGGKKGGNANQHLTNAIGHIEQAIAKHGKNQQNANKAATNTNKNGKAHHHPLHEALHAAKEAEKHLASGNSKLAKEEIAKAQHHINEVMQHQKK